jgi:hypothetical protein
MDHFITQKQAQGLEKENESLKNQLKLMEDDLNFYEQDAPCGHPQKFWKIEPNQDAWCTLCAVEKLAIENSELRLALEKLRKALKAMTATTDPVCECGKPISAHILYDDGIRRYCEIDRDGNVILECDGFKRLEI